MNYLYGNYGLGPWIPWATVYNPAINQVSMPAQYAQLAASSMRQTNPTTPNPVSLSIPHEQPITPAYTIPKEQPINAIRATNGMPANFGQYNGYTGGYGAQNNQFGNVNTEIANAMRMRLGL
jgi:hypothetical protein